MINRAAVLLRYKEPAVRWINDADPSPRDAPITLAEVNEERTVYLIGDDDAEDRDAFGRWLKTNYEWLFEFELEGWYTDEALWPKDRSFKMFKEWFEAECHTMLLDTLDDTEISDVSDREHR